MPRCCVFKGFIWLFRGLDKEEDAFYETCDSDLIKAAIDKDKKHHLTNQSKPNGKAADVKRTFDMFANDDEFDSLNVSEFYFGLCLRI